MSVAVEYDLSPGILAGLASFGSIEEVVSVPGWTSAKIDEATKRGEEFCACLENDIAIRI